MKRCPLCSTICLPIQAFCSACGASLSDAAQVAGDPYLGSVLAGRYRVVKKLGEGGMGSVYRAEVLDIGHTVAVKLLHERFVGDGVALQRFEREAQVASKLNHPNSIGILDFGHTTTGTSFLVMEYLKGVSLAEVLDKERVSLVRAVHILRQILAVLEAAHAMSIVHRDLKPANVFLIKYGENPDHVKVLDFGIARLRRETGQRVTRTGMVCGTPEYMSPEQARGAELDARSDLYSAGIIFYEMLTGRRPFEGKSATEVMTAQISDSPIPPSVRAPERGIPPSLDAIVLWALSKAPEDRFPSAVEFHKVIDEWATVIDPAESGPLELICPGCSAHVAEDATRCPQCGESLEPALGIGGPGVYAVSPSQIIQDHTPSEQRAVQMHMSREDERSALEIDSDAGVRIATPSSAPQLALESGRFEVPSPTSVPFIGHQALLDELEQQLSGPGMHCARFVGPPGIGKRRVASTLLGRLSSEGRKGIHVWPDPSDVAEPLGAVQRAATRLLELPCEPMSVDDLGDATTPLGLDEAVTYGLADLFNLGKPAGVDITERRRRRAVAWRQLVETAARNRPISLLFENFERLDGASRELILALAASDAKASVAVVLTHRPEFVALWPSTFREIQLPRLADEELEELVIEFSDGELEDEDNSWRIQASGGNPLHLMQLVALHSSDPGQESPRGLADLIALRAGRLPPPVQTVLQSAAVFGDHVDQEALKEIAPAHPVKEALDALTPRAFLTSAADGLRFLHPYIRQVIYAAIPAGVRAERHSRVAVYLQKISASPVVLAHHLWHSEEARDLALPSLISAGEWALSVLDEEGAILALRRALTLLPSPSAAETDDDIRAAWQRAIFGLITALARSGDREEAQLLLSSAVEEATAAGWHAEASRLEDTVKI